MSRKAGFARRSPDRAVKAKAGREYIELGKYSMNEVIMATPAISDGTIIIRTLGHLYGIGAP